MLNSLEALDYFWTHNTSVGKGFSYCPTRHNKRHCLVGHTFNHRSRLKFTGSLPGLAFVYLRGSKIALITQLKHINPYLCTIIECPTYIADCPVAVVETSLGAHHYKMYYMWIARLSWCFNFEYLCVTLVIIRIKPFYSIMSLCNTANQIYL